VARLTESSRQLFIMLRKSSQRGRAKVHFENFARSRRAGSPGIAEARPDRLIQHLNRAFRPERPAFPENLRLALRGVAFGVLLPSKLKRL